MELRESVFRVSKSRYPNISHHFGTPSVSHKWNSKKKKKNLTSTSQNIGYQFLVAALNFHLLFMKHWGGGGKVSFKYPANIVGKICPPWPPPQCHEFCRILWGHWCSHLVTPMFPSNQGVFPSPFCFFLHEQHLKGMSKNTQGYP